MPSQLFFFLGFKYRKPLISGTIQSSVFLISALKNSCMFAFTFFFSLFSPFLLFNFPFYNSTSYILFSSLKATSLPPVIQPHIFFFHLVDKMKIDNVYILFYRALSHCAILLIELGTLENIFSICFVPFSAFIYLILFYAFSFNRFLESIEPSILGLERFSTVHFRIYVHCLTLSDTLRLCYPRKFNMISNRCKEPKKVFYNSSVFVWLWCHLTLEAGDVISISLAI